MKILHICSTLNSDGIARILHSYFTKTSQDCKVDFIINKYPIKGILEDDFIKKSSSIMVVPRFEENKIKNLQLFEEILKNNQYDIIHCHMHFRNLFYLKIAKKYGVKVRINHSHVSFENEKFTQKLKHFLVSPIICRLATDLWACSRDAGIFMYGKKNIKKDNFYVMNNAIDIEKYKYLTSYRNSIRDELNLKDEFVIGCIGRYTYQKNYEFLLEIFKEIQKNEPCSKLLIVGARHNFGDDKNVISLGIKENVNEIMSAMDCFVLPSRYEGLGIVYIEAQANGMPTFASDKVPQDTSITDLIQYIPLKKSAKEWAKQIVSTKLKKDEERIAYNNSVKNSNFNLETEVLKVEEKYMRLIERG